MDAIRIAVNNSKTIIALSENPHLPINRRPSSASFGRNLSGIRKFLMTSISSGFKDNSHLSFYCNASGGLHIANDDSTKRKRSKKKESKKPKRLRELRKDLINLSRSAIEYNLDPPCIEAIDLLTKRLEQFGAASMENNSSSSSESSDSDKEDCRLPAPQSLKTQSSDKITTSETQLSRIEVCTGGKCKKSGSIAVMEALKNSEEITYPVVGSKCMGRCKTAPNVKVFTSPNNANEVNTTVQSLLAKNAL